jgi:hypothetical protein
MWLSEAPHWYEQQAKRQIHPKTGEFFSLDETLRHSHRGQFSVEGFLRRGVFKAAIGRTGRPLRKQPETDSKR